MRVDQKSGPVGFFRSPASHHTTRWLIAAALLAAVSLAAACGRPPAGGGPVTLVFKHAKILGPTDPVADLLRKFEALHPGVSVKSESLPWTTDEQHQYYVINMEGGAPAFDVLMLDVIWVPEFARAGWLLDLTDRVPQAELAAHFRSAVDAATFRGRVWALPWIMNVGLLYYRKDLLDKYGLRPPDTYDELVDQVRRIRAGEHDPRLDGFLWQGKQYEGLVVNALEVLWADGTRLLDEDGRLFPDAARAEEALAYLRMMIATGISPPWVTAADEELTRRAFGDGRAVFLRNWPYVLDLLERPGSPVRGRVGIAALPRQAHGIRGAGSTGGAHLGVHRRTRHPELATALVRFLTSEEAQRTMAGGVALNPTRTALYHDAALVASHPAYPEFYRLILAGRPRPVTPYYLMLSSTLQPELSAVIVGIESPRDMVRRSRARVAHMLRDLK
jgi:multiple sugar transport system substrate-binding protein